MALERVIFDTTVFNYFLRIKCIDLDRLMRSLIINNILIPSQIIEEMERLAIKEPSFKTKIYKWIDLAHSRRFYHYCDTYDSIVFDTIKRELDIGEAGAIAQAEKTNVYWFISDDIKNLPFLKLNYSHIRQHSLFFLIALADLAGLLPEYEKVLINFLQIRKYQEFSPAKRKQLKKLIRNDYIAALQLKGLYYNKKLVSQKTSIDTILKRNIPS